MSSPQDVAVNDSTGVVYVADTGNHRVDEFSASGTFIRAWGWGVADGASSFETCTTACEAGVSGGGVGQFESPAFVAVDNSATGGGDVYVADTGTHLVQKFDANGNLITTWGDGGAASCGAANGQLSGACASGGPFTGIAGIAVDGSGNLFVYDPNSHNWFKFGQAGSADPTVSIGRGTDNAGTGVDNEGNFYKVVAAGNVERYSSSGSDIGDVTDGESGITTGFAIDPTTNDVYADDGGTLIRHYDGSSLAMCVPASDCQTADSFGTGHLTGGAGVGHNSATGTVYVADPAAGDIAAFAPGVLADATTGQASSITGTSATLNGTVNPDATTITSCQFQYLDANDYNPAAAAPFASAPAAACAATPSASNAVAVSASVSGLTPATLYYYRLETGNSNGATIARTATFATLGTPGGPIPAAGAAGLPDGRVYEQVSPVNKDGNTAGATPAGGVEGVIPDYTLATADGGAVISGDLNYPEKDFGSNSYGFQPFTVYRRSGSGWSASGLLPPENEEPNGAFSNEILGLLPAADLSSAVFGTSLSFGSAPRGALDLVGADGSVSWLSTPTVADPFTSVLPTPWVVGGSRDLGRVYFGYDGTLVPSDDQGNPVFGGASRSSVLRGGDGASLGLYEWTPTGGVRYAAVLPDGSVDPYGASPASYGASPGDGAELLQPIDYATNPVSSDGSRLFFVSPDPVAGAPASDPVELYVRETAAEGSQSTALISKSAVTGQPAADPPISMAFPHPNETGAVGQSYIYASPDGSHVFFEDVDALTSDAPNDATVKAYVFDTVTNTLSYLPGVAGQPNGGRNSDCPSSQMCTSPVLVSSSDGSELLFLRETPGGESLDLASGGTVTPVAQFPEAADCPAGASGVLGSGTSGLCILPEARATGDGSVFVFETNSPIYTTAPGQFNNAGGFEQVYRYVVSSGQLSCLSCGPAGVTHTGDAIMSNDGTPGEINVVGGSMVDSRGLSADGDRVFFDSPDPLVPQASNGQRNVYEWEAAGDGSCAASSAGGCLYLISSGQSSSPDFFLDNSSSGNDVFFATAQGLVAQDTTQDYDIYDARVGGGFPSPGGPAPCAGDACQGPVSGVPSLPTAATVSFSGPGNMSTAATKTPPRVLTHTVRGASFLIRVNAPGRGAITVTGPGIKAARESISRSGAYALRITLTTSERRLLARRPKLRLMLRVSYAPPGASADGIRVGVTVEPAVRHGRRQARRPTRRARGGAR